MSAYAWQAAEYSGRTWRTGHARQRLAIIEAMKMEHTLVAPTDGTIADISVAGDAQVAEGRSSCALSRRKERANKTNLVVPLHLIKLCVGCDSVSDLESWIKQKLKEKRRRGQKVEHIHTTNDAEARDRIDKRRLLYWVIRGQIACRERILDVRAFVDKDGIGRCRVVLDGRWYFVEPRPRSAFQGWRYLEAKKRRAICRAPRQALCGCRKPCEGSCRRWSALDRHVVDQSGLTSRTAASSRIGPSLTWKWVRA